jgi:D-3-phosphoglycerate dehydrogenase
MSSMGFGRIAAHDTYVSEELFHEFGVECLSFEDLCRKSDIITVHLPLTENSRHIVGETAISLMKNTTIIVNTARGPLIDEPALVRALTSGKLAMAALDVFETEPKRDPNDPLTRLENVILTPHVAFDSEEAITDQIEMAAMTIRDVLSGVRRENIVNTDVLTRENMRVKLV